MEGSSDRVRLVRTGGFGGIEMRGELAVKDLDAGEVEMLRSLVEQRDRAGHAQAHRAGTAPDAMRYELLVQLGGGPPHTLVYTDIDMPPALRPLVQRLTSVSRGTGT